MGVSGCFEIIEDICDPGKKEREREIQRQREIEEEKKRKLAEIEAKKGYFLKKEKGKI